MLKVTPTGSFRWKTGGTFSKRPVLEMELHRQGSIADTSPDPYWYETIIDDRVWREVKVEDITQWNIKVSIEMVEV